MIGRLATFASSSVMWPSKPASMKPAVEWISSPSRPRLDLPSTRPTRSSGTPMRSSVDAEHELAGMQHERADRTRRDLDQLGEVLHVLLHVDDPRRCDCGTRGTGCEIRTSIDDGWISDSSSGSITMRPSASCSRSVRSDRITTETVLAGRRANLSDRCGCSSMVEHQLPKLRTRVRFPSSALKDESALPAGRRRIGMQKRGT